VSPNSTENPSGIGLSETMEFCTSAAYNSFQVTLYEHMLSFLLLRMLDSELEGKITIKCDSVHSVKLFRMSFDVCLRRAFGKIEQIMLTVKYNGCYWVTGWATLVTYVDSVHKWYITIKRFCLTYSKYSTDTALNTYQPIYPTIKKSITNKMTVLQIYEA